MKNTMNKKLASSFSYLLAPPFMNFLLFLILSGKSERPEFMLGISFLFGVFLPVVVFIYLRKKEKIVNDDATVKEERTLPYMIGAVLCIVAAGIFYYSKIELLFVNLWIIYFITSLTITIINKFWKISAHAMGAAIPLGVLLYLGNDFFLLFLIFLIIAMWARLTLRVHTVAQVFWGAVAGSVIPIIILRILS